MVISGSGNVAQYALEKAIHLGAKVVTVSDSGGYVFRDGGFHSEHLDAIQNIKNVKRGRIKELAEMYGDIEYHEGEKPWGVKCDIALPCATQNELDGDDAATLLSNGCMCVSEGANMPSTPEAIHKFHEAKILFAPGKASNAGGVATSGLEMSQNSLRLSWSREEVDQKLHGIMVSIHEACEKYGREGDYVDYVKGANVAGFIKVADAMIAQGHV